MTRVSVQDFVRELECAYDGERYSARDNGAVLRHPRHGRRQRAVDGQWTFGKPNEKTGYMEIASVRVHRIVATAFHGNPPTPQYVVDHVDTNRRNNRPENLRWLTRLENALKNPITAKRIEFICGSIEAFLADPSKLGQSKLDQNFAWMRTVSAEEGQRSLARMLAWAKSDKPSSGGTLGEWLFAEIPSTPPPAPEVEAPEPLVMGLTPATAQRGWRTPSEFPSCPRMVEQDALTAYRANLAPGAVFSRNRFSESIVSKAALADKDRSLWVMCAYSDEMGLKPWSLAQVTLEDGLYVHASHGTFFTEEGAEKQFTLAQGLEWTGGDSIDGCA
jgi:hypothetical protein